MSLVFARAAAIRVDLRELFQQRLHLLPPDRGRWPDPPPDERAYRGVRAKAGRIGRSAGAPDVLLAAADLEPALRSMSPGVAPRSWRWLGSATGGQPPRRSCH